MENTENLKQLVKDKYGRIALQSKETNEASCCGSSCCENTDEAVFAEDYSHLKGYTPEADLGLGCGLPTEYAQIKKGDTVLDLGSGAGNDCFVARTLVGEEGKVIGVDMTESMVEKARQNALKLGYDNVAFILGDIESLPLPDHLVDVVVSNCVLNLVPDKEKAFAHTFRVLKPGGHFSISDVVVQGTLPGGLQEDAEMYAGCVAGALPKPQYLEIIRQSGFEQITIQKEREIVLPDETLARYLSADEIKTFRESRDGIFSITVYAKKSYNRISSRSFLK